MTIDSALPGHEETCPSAPLLQLFKILPGDGGSTTSLFQGLAALEVTKQLSVNFRNNGKTEGTSAILMCLRGTVNVKVISHLQVALAKGCEGRVRLQFSLSCLKTKKR